MEEGTSLSKDGREKNEVRETEKKKRATETEVQM